eukprot:3942006-Rhodomonas_salina.3
MQTTAFLVQLQVVRRLCLLVIDLAVSASPNREPQPELHLPVPRGPLAGPHLGRQPASEGPRSFRPRPLEPQRRAAGSRSEGGSQALRRGSIGALSALLRASGSPPPSSAERSAAWVMRLDADGGRRLSWQCALLHALRPVAAVWESTHPVWTAPCIRAHVTARTEHGGSLVGGSGNSPQDLHNLPQHSDKRAASQAGSSLRGWRQRSSTAASTAARRHHHHHAGVSS